MASPTLFLHIGSPKTGTTYIQDMLWANRQRLEERQVLLPGHYRYARVQAVRDLMKWQPVDGADLPASWNRIAAEVSRWSGRSVILSMEFLAWATEEQARALYRSVGKSPVKVILTTRDLARLVPAQWQTAMRQRNTWTLDEYADAVAGVAQGKDATQAANHFWRRQDYGPIILQWAKVVGIENVTVVTLPPSGSDPSELWRRFCAATELLPDDYETGEASHESLGAASAEIMRRLNATAPIEGLDMRSYQKSVNGALSRRVLAPRRRDEPHLILPEAHRDWANRESERVIAEVAATGAMIIGDLEDLRPRPGGSDPIAPENLPAEELLAAAIDGLAGLSAEYARQRKKLDELKDRKASKVDRVKAPLQESGVSGLKASWRRRKPRD